MGEMPLPRLEAIFGMAAEGPVRNPGNLDWMLAILLHARSQGRRVLLGGLYGNHTISWDGWAQTAAHLKQARLLTALRQWRLYYRCSGYSAATTLRKLIIEPAMPKRLADWLDRRRSLARRAPWQRSLPRSMRTSPARCGVEERARKVGHDFLYRVRSDERIKRLTAVDYAGDWFAAGEGEGHRRRSPRSDCRYRRGRLLPRRSRRAISR